ncbi:DUF397 domain-containing protein [Streptomyces sp. ML-6]|uniref:DUF397 domain-containing protein n=1 Tax=Streptomyces sp. ML-6 TaxID=2982693 RepID=UPI0024C053EB|nr:DUF397 domain-containing protein [Streptomyces sp. ML-6]MDK0521037.1 DUF397 domain-containing protein [Streptomyces sp. ML-6]
MTDAPDLTQGRAAPAWQKSSYCAQGEACIPVAVPTPGTIGLTESADPTRTVLRTTPTAWAALVRTIKEDRSHD